MDIFGKDFEKWILLNRYGLPVPEKEAITAFMESNDCTTSHLAYIIAN